MGLGVAGTVDVVPSAGACSQQGLGGGITGGGGLVGGVSFSDSDPGSTFGGYQMSTMEVSAGVGWMLQRPSSPAGGGPSYTWMAWC